MSFIVNLMLKYSAFIILDNSLFQLVCCTDQFFDQNSVASNFTRFTLFSNSIYILAEFFYFAIFRSIDYSTRRGINNK